jgi:hypothetical protein
MEWNEMKWMGWDGVIFHSPLCCLIILKEKGDGNGHTDGIGEEDEKE